MIDARVGILDVQGASAPHGECFAALGLRARPVRALADLREVTHLVLPGGESTAIHRILARVGLRDEIVSRHAAGTLALFGTCAGAILLGREDIEPPPRLGLLDVRVHRNAYGRQADSFVDAIDIEPLGIEIRAPFIRAPRFAEVGPGVRVLARLRGEPVLVAGDRILAATFHPELSGDPRVHRFFLDAFPSAGSAEQVSLAAIPATGASP